MTYNIAHTNPDGKTGVAQATIEARSEGSAREKFAERYPKRRLLTVAKLERGR